LLSEQNVGATQIREYLAAKAGGKVNLHYGKKDVNNQIASEHRKLVGVDVNAMVDYFKRRQQDDPDFFFAIEPDEDNAARNIFWVDGQSRMAYEEFGNVVTFDTTYNTNKYSMHMAPFIDVSHHQHSIFFGCALIRDEKKTIFFWLFQIWLDAMGGKKPKDYSY
jgi:MULE transposase domain